ncbi:MAG: tetratricopeptide repeat protein, partial [Deltaproteobacteria bacterium]|nr:tetratricopeptide repeat protein [Deltaproteobacteria bacterium]
MRPLTLGVLALLLFAPATARGDRATTEAKAHFEQGNARYNLGEYREALEAYRRAYRVKPLPGFLFNVAQCHRNLGEYEEAISFYERYLEAAPATPNRVLVTSLLAESREKLLAKRRAQEEETARRARAPATQAAASAPASA